MAEQAETPQATEPQAIGLDALLLSIFRGLLLNLLREDAEVAKVLCGRIVDVVEAKRLLEERRGRVEAGHA